MPNCLKYICQCSVSKTFWEGSGSLDPYTGLRIQTLLFSPVGLETPTKNKFFFQVFLLSFSRRQQKISFFIKFFTKFFVYYLVPYLLRVHLQQSSKIKSMKSQNGWNQRFSLFFCLLWKDRIRIRTNNYGSGSWGPQNWRNLRIRLRNTVFVILFSYSTCSKSHRSSIAFLS
jgi:hypothetical protein